MKTRLFFIIFSFITLAIKPAGAQNIYTVAGNGTAGYYGNGGPATSAELYTPASVTFGATPSYYYIGDEQNNVIRMVNINTGIITTVAGNGIGGYYGDGGPATSAEMNWVIDVVLDTAGNMYISELAGQRIRKVNKKTGIITTFTGTGSPGYSGDGGPASSAVISSPRYMVVDDSDNLYFADQGNNVIRKVNLQTNIITTVIGTGTAGFSGDGGPAGKAELTSPYGITFDSHYNMFIADQGNDCVREVNKSTGIITTVAGIGGVGGYSGNGGPATSAKLSGDASVTVGSTGNLYIADTYNHVIRKVAKNTGIITTIAGTGVGGYNGDGISATSAELNYPGNVILDSCGSLYISDWGNSRVREVIGQDNPITISGKTPVCPGSNDTLVVSGGGTYKWSNGATTSSIIVSVASTTTYTVGISNSCSNAVRDTSIKITVTSFRIGISQNDTICDGNSVGLSAIGGGTYKWSPTKGLSGINIPNPVASPTVTTTYSVMITNNGCSKDTSVKVMVNPLPSVTLSGKDSICLGNSTILNATGGGTYKWSNGATTSSINVKPNNSITYSIAVTNNGCLKDTTVMVIVNPLPSISIAGNSNICAGDPTTLYASGGGTYLWNNGATTSSITVAPVTNETYSVTVNDNGCSKDTTISVKVSTLSASIAGPLTLCQGDSATLYSSGGGTYKWSTGSTTSSIVIKPLSTTTYSVLITNGPCAKDTSITVTVKICNTTGVGDYHNPSSLVNLYPNPNNGNFTISLSTVSQKCIIYIYNVLSQQVYQSNINSDNTEINLSNQPKGIYLYRVISATGSLVGEGKVVVQ